MDANSGQGHQSPSEEIPSLDSLGLQHPLLPPPALGQSFLQPHTLSPLGAVSLINLDTPLPTETAWANSLGSQVPNQVPGEAIGNGSTGLSNISDSFVTQSPETQPNTLAPKVPTESLQPKLEQTPSHQRQSSAQNNPGKIDSNAASTPKVQQAPSLETGAVINNDQPQISAPSIQPAQDREQETRERPVTKQAESGTQIAQEQNSPEITLQPKLNKAQQFSPPPAKSHLQQSTLSPVSPSQDETTGDQTSSEVVSKQTISESKQKSEQTTNPIVHSTSNAISPEVSTSAEAPDGSPLQAKHQNILETKVASEPSIIQESLPQSHEQSTSPNSEVKSSGPKPSPSARATNDDPSPTQDSVISAPNQPSIQKASATNDHSLDRSAQTAQVAQSKEVSLPTASPPSSQKPVISAQPNQEPQVSSTQPNKSQSVSIQTSLEAIAQSNKEVATKSSQQGTDTSTDLPNSQPIESQSISQTSLETTAHSEQVSTKPSQQGTNSNTAKPASETIQSSPIPPIDLQPSNSQLSLTNSKEDANPSSSTDSSSSTETPITSSSPTIPRGKSIETTPIEQVAQASPQQSLGEKPLLIENSETPNSTAQSSESQTDTTVIQKIESSAAQQSSTDHPHTSKIETNQTSPTSPSSSSNETPPTSSTTQKTDEDAARATVIQRADEPSPEASTKTTSKQQIKKNKQKKIPLQAQLSRMGKRAKQDIHKVGIQLKQASHSFPTGQSRAKTKGLQKSTSDSPQPSNPPSIQTKSSPDSKQSPSEVPLVQSEAEAIEQVSPQESVREEALLEKTEIANHEQNSLTVQAAPESKDSPQKHPHATPATSEPTIEPTIDQDIQSDSVTDLQKKSESASDFTITGQHRNNSESSTPEVSVNQLKTTSSPSATSSAGTETSRLKTKKWGQLPAHPLKRLTHLSQQVMDTVSRQLEPHPNEEFNPFQRQEQNLPKNSNQKREDQTISPASLHRSVNGDPQPLQDSGSENKSAATSIQSDIQAKSYLPNASLDTASLSKPELSSDEQAHLNSQTDYLTDVSAEEHRQTQELPTVQKAEDSQSSSPPPPQSAQVDFPTSNSIETTSPAGGDSSASVVESQTNTPIPEWQLIQNQLADRITNLGSEIRQRVDRSILKQSSRRKLPQPTQIKETDSAQITTSSEVAQTDQPLNSAVSELNGENIQATTESIADPVKGIEQPSLTATEQLASTSDAVTESPVQTESSSVVVPSQKDISHPQAFTIEPSIQSRSVDKAKTSKPQQDSEQNNPALLHENEDTIQRDSAETSSSSSEQPITNVSSQSSANFGTAIPEASQSRDRNRPFNSPISKLRTTIVQQLTNLKPKKTKPKTKAKKQKSVSSPAKMSRETTETDSTTSLNLQAKQEETAQSTEHPNSPEHPNVTPSDAAEQAVSTTSISDAIQRQDIAPQQSSPLDRSDVPIPQSKTSPPSGSLPLPQDEGSIHGEIDANEPPGGSGTNETDANPNNILQRETEQEKSQPERPEAQTQPLQVQNVLDTESPLSDRPPIREIAIQTKVEQQSATNQPQFPTSPTSSIQQSSQTQGNLSSESNQSNLKESSEAVTEADTSETSSQNLDGPIVQTSQIKEQVDNQPNGTSPTIQAQEDQGGAAVSEQSFSVSSPHVPIPNSDNSAIDSTLNSKNLESQGHQAPQAPSKSSDASGKTTTTDGIIQRKIEAHIDSDQPFFTPKEDSSTASKPLNDQSISSETSIPGKTSAQIEPHTEPSNLELKQASTVPIQSVEISVIQPATEPQLQKDNLGQSFDNCDRTPESPLEPGDKLTIQPTPEIQPIEQPDQQQAVPNRDSETAPTTDASLTNDIPKATTGPALQASSIEPSPDPSIAPNDISATSEIIQPKHQSHIGSELKTDPDLSTGQIQANSTLLAESSNTDTPTPDLQKHPTDNLGESPPENVERIQSQPDQNESSHRRIIEIPAQRPDGNIEKANLSDQDIASSSSLELNENQSLQRSSEANSSLPERNFDPANPKPSSNIAEQSEISALPQADSSPQKVEHIQPQLDQIDSPHRRIIEIPAQRPDENLANDNLHPKDSASSSSSDLHEDPILQRTVEINSSLVETDLDRTNRDISSTIGETSEVAELSAKPDSKLQHSEADTSSLASVQPLSTPPLKSTIQRQAQAEDTLNSPPQPIDPVDAQPGSADSLQRRVIEIAAQSPEPRQPEGNSPDLTVAQLLATGQSPSPLSNIADNFVSPKFISNLLPSSQPNRKHHSQKLRDFQNPNAPLQRKDDDETGRSGEGYEINTEDAIAPTIQPSNNPTLPSNWSSIEDLFTTQPSVIQPKAEKPTATPEDTSDFVLTPTGIYPEKQVPRKTVFAQRTAQPLQKSPTTAPPVSSTPQTTEVVMRQFQTEKLTEPEVDEQSFEILAREIYHVLRQRLEVERERHGGYQSGRLPW
ncbi:hypothetical protein [Acaryochloris marina]|uniref:Uncharacterized protein n=1 Tax=Acaryochloris marina (strain MBIC 11017) TaxID=329726 RepID=B0C1L4_ACAM1|nr:hypothetical protein [Acaryochloris marina]ABW30848.1 hypothetical protein AM1_5909 [Acaryochloris marina MBIC11017]BDM79597.1 hypothetical protein AM10699_24650 [Acaryochloris marina MBIC10699]